jgi:hypothetical protein
MRSRAKWAASCTPWRYRPVRRNPEPKAAATGFDHFSAARWKLLPLRAGAAAD